MSFLARYNPEMPVVAVDTETALFAPGKMAPRLVCVSYAEDGTDDRVGLLDREDGKRYVRRLLERAARGECVISGQNIPYDFCVLAEDDPTFFPLIFDAYEVGGIHDTMCAEWLLDTAEGLLRLEFDEDTQEWKAKKSYSLENLTRIYLGWPFYKDEWRLRYAELADVPIAQYPEAAAIYPKRDALGTWLVTRAQRERALRIRPHDPLAADLAAQCRAYMALALVSAWGMELDPELSRELVRGLNGAMLEIAPDLAADGLLLHHVRGKKAGTYSRRMGPLREAIAADFAARDLEPLLTKGGALGLNKQVSTTVDVLQSCTDERLGRMAEYLAIEKMLNGFAEPLQRFGRGPIHPRYNYADTGRTTCSGGKKGKGRTAVNVQQLPKKLPKFLRSLGDIRSLFVPRPGWVMSSSDYKALEMTTHAQVLLWMFGSSDLADALNAGIDPHVHLAAREFLHIPYDDAKRLCKVKGTREADMRQLAKVPNFGLPGGMGAAKLCVYAWKNYELRIEEADARSLKQAWLRTWREMGPYLQEIGAHVEVSDVVVQWESGRIRGGVGFTDAANGFFQALAADGAKDALWHIVRECYDGRLRSVLLGSRVTAFVHDEFIAEHPVEAAHEAATRLAEIAVERMRLWTPDIRQEVEPALMMRWSKDAETARNAHGRLIPWEHAQDRAA